ncbi:hypothetical protein [Tolypothrix sp. VBCCA 56010]|uniref:hypothetical protein n=1 Tax=Tolypothrix sp. VBCCA 56010 TaxID=3137731 RepID=UPI003D7E85D0
MEEWGSGGVGEWGSGGVETRGQGRQGRQGEFLNNTPQVVPLPPSPPLPIPHYLAFGTNIK